MAKVLRCPICGALWRLKDDDEAEICRCSACYARFALAKAEIAVVPDRMLDEAAALKQTKLAGAAKAAQASQAAPEADFSEGLERLRAVDPEAPAEYNDGRDAVMAKLAADMSGFDSPDRPEEPAQKPSAFFAGLFKFIAASALLCVLGICALLCFSDKVLESIPALRSAYESVCGKVPCPGFVWAQPSAFEIAAGIERAEGADLKRPVVDITLTNASAHPQRLPVLELRFLDPAGDTIAQRVLEPAEYGVDAPQPTLPAGEKLKATITVKKDLAYEAADVSVSPVELF